MPKLVAMLRTSWEESGIAMLDHGEISDLGTVFVLVSLLPRDRSEIPVD